MTDPLVPLALAAFMIFAAVLIPQARMNWPLWLRAASSIAIFAALSLVLWQLIGTPLRPHLEPRSPARNSGKN